MDVNSNKFSLFPVSVPDYYDYDWGLVALSMPEIHIQNLRGAGVIIGIHDTGTPTHPRIDWATDGMPHFGGADTHGHAYAVAGVIRQWAPDARIMCANNLTNIEAGFRHLVDNGCHIINMSYAASWQLIKLRDEIRRAISLGRVVVAAAGNTGDSSVMYPGSYPETISVGAFNSSAMIWPLSTWRDSVTCSMPGQYIKTFWNNTDHSIVSLSGTSLAAPALCGVLACAAGRRIMNGRMMFSQNEAKLAIENNSIMSIRCAYAPGVVSDLMY